MERIRTNIETLTIARSLILRANTLPLRAREASRLVAGHRARATVLVAAGEIEAAAVADLLWPVAGALAFSGVADFRLSASAIA
jgi:hypothetical protein